MTRFKVIGYEMHNAELNLATEFKRVVNKALQAYPNETLLQIAERLGICERALSRIISEWGLKRPAKKRKYRNFKVEGSKYF
jgi:hypothetical protein